MVQWRICSVFCYYGLTILFCFQNSHQISHRRYELAEHLLPDLFGLVHTFHRVRKYRMFLVYRFTPVLLHHHHHRLRFRCRSFSGSGRSQVFRLECHGVFRPGVRTFRPGPVDNVGSLG